MFNLGFTEMILLAGIALIVIGPKQLPDMARMLGRMINEFRRATSDFTSSIDDFKVKSRNYMSDTEKMLTEAPKKRPARSAEDDEDSGEPRRAAKKRSPEEPEQLAFGEAFDQESLGHNSTDPSKRKPEDS